MIAVKTFIKINTIINYQLSYVIPMSYHKLTFMFISLKSKNKLYILFSNIKKLYILFLSMMVHMNDIFS